MVDFRRSTTVENRLDAYIDNEHVTGRHAMIHAINIELRLMQLLMLLTSGRTMADQLMPTEANTMNAATT
jgi:hypothetical protein